MDAVVGRKSLCFHKQRGAIQTRRRVGSKTPIRGVAGGVVVSERADIIPGLESTSQELSGMWERRVRRCATRGERTRNYSPAILYDVEWAWNICRRM